MHWFLVVLVQARWRRPLARGSCYSRGRVDERLMSEES
jgi:hypothetical protein